ncbi:hypothetical protein AAHB46_12165 [Bacillus paranthracis]
MEYKWEKESLQKYGEEATQILITKQKNTKHYTRIITVSIVAKK